MITSTVDSLLSQKPAPLPKSLYLTIIDVFLNTLQFFSQQLSMSLIHDSLLLSKEYNKTINWPNESLLYPSQQILL